MARGRIISKSISHSSKLARLYETNPKLADFTILLFTWIIPHTDDYGQISSDITGLKLQVMPASTKKTKDFEAALSLLVENNLLQQQNGALKVVNFEKFQSFRSDRNKQNMFPDLEWHTIDIPVTPAREVKGSKEKLSKDNINTTSGSENIIEIPLIKRDGTFEIFQKDIDEWQTTFPGVDILLSLKRIRQWNLDCPDNRKTAKGIRKHISTWLGKEQDRSKKKPGPTVSSRPKGKENLEEEIGAAIDYLNDDLDIRRVSVERHGKLKKKLEAVKTLEELEIWKENYTGGG